MNGTYYNNDYELNNTNSGFLIDELLKINTKKKAKIYITIPGSNTYQDKEFNGIIENVGKDHIIISNPSNGEWNIIPIIYIAFITFDEVVNY